VLDGVDPLQCDGDAGGRPPSGLHVRQHRVDSGATGLAIGAVTAESFTHVTNVVDGRP
jgi:hypothetical protein